MVDSSRSHIYPPLDKSSSKIRLIHLQPRSRNNNIICRLCIVDLDADNLKYEALSYEWGETNISRSILLNGKEFSVRENLWSALTYLRHDEVERVLWIDAICIDQSDKGERNHQVGLMAQVYSRASRVVVWLGKDGQEDFTRVASFIDMLAEESHLNDLVKDETQAFLPHYVPRVDSWPSTAAARWSVPVNLLHGSGSKWMSEDEHRRGWEAWDNICHRSYWSRLWILQELILARTLVLRCGNVELEWESLYRIFHRPRTSSGRLIHSSHAIIPVLIYQRRVPIPLLVHSGIYGNPDGRAETSTTLANQFLMYGEAKCADVRDRIFGLLGISPQCCRDSIPVDYSLSTIDLALSVIAHDESEHRSFRSASFSSKLRADSYIEYLECANDAHRIIAAIEATDGPLWPPFGSPEEEQELWRRHDSSVVTFIQDGQLVQSRMFGMEIVRNNMFVKHRSFSKFH